MNKENIEEILKKLGAEDIPDDAHKIAQEASEQFNITLIQSRQHILWEHTMKSPIIKLAAAAVIIIVVLLSITFFDIEAIPAYALGQSIEANHTIQTIHLRIWHGEESSENDEFMDCWVKYDDVGLVSNFRWNLYGDVRDDDDNLRFTVWNEGVLKTWMPLKNVVIVIRVNDAETYWQNFAKNYDPKLILQRLYDDSQHNEAIEITINESSKDGEPIYVEAINSVDNTRLELVVDSETKLVTQLSKYSLGEHKDELVMEIEFLAYNQPIDPSVFKLSGIPDDALVYDQVDQLVGLEKGNLTDNEIAVRVVRKCLEATIAQDYEEVSRLMEGDPGDSFEVFLEEEYGAKISRVISFGHPKPHDIWDIILCVPCEIEVENEKGEKWIVSIIATTKPIGYQLGNRWIVHTEIYNQLGLVGLEKGDLTKNEIAIKVVRECLEATIAQDYEEVSRLMEGAPGDTIEVFIREEFGAKISRVISFGHPKPHDIWDIILCVPCEIEVENEKGEKWIVNIIATAKPIGYQPVCRWIMHTDIKANE